MWHKIDQCGPRSPQDKPSWPTGTPVGPVNHGARPFNNHDFPKVFAIFCYIAVLRNRKLRLACLGLAWASSWTILGPKSPPNGPSWPQDGPNMAQYGVRWPQESPRCPKDGPKMAKMTRIMAQEAPKLAQGGPKMAPIWPQNGSKTP
jgi:hypothetical protein